MRPVNQVSSAHRQPESFDVESQQDSVIRRKSDLSVYCVSCDSVVYVSRILCTIRCNRDPRAKSDCTNYSKHSASNLLDCQLCSIKEAEKCQIKYRLIAVGIKTS